VPATLCTYLNGYNTQTKEKRINFLQKLLQGIAFVPAVVNGIEGLFGNRTGQERKESAISFVGAALQLTEAVANREIVDEVKFKAGLSKVIDGAVECLNASSWAPKTVAPALIERDLRRLISVQFQEYRSFLRNDCERHCEGCQGRSARHATGAEGGARDRSTHRPGFSPSGWTGARRICLLGMAAQAVGETGDAVAANGVNIALDAQLVADIKGLIAAIEKYAQTAGATKPAK
jgi:hypothetical protein